MVVTVGPNPLVRDEGTIVVLQGTDENGEWVQFGAGHRMAQVILDAAAVEGEAACEVEPYMIVATAR